MSWKSFTWEDWAIVGKRYTPGNVTVTDNDTGESASYTSLIVEIISRISGLLQSDVQDAVSNCTEDDHYIGHLASPLPAGGANIDYTAQYCTWPYETAGGGFPTGGVPQQHQGEEELLTITKQIKETGGTTKTVVSYAIRKRTTESRRYVYETFAAADAVAAAFASPIGMKSASVGLMPCGLWEVVLSMGDAEAWENLGGEPPHG